jgi:hypothetical protein
LCWLSGGATTYVIWDPSDEDGTVPIEVSAVVATALCELGSVAFLGGPGALTSNSWQRLGEAWVGVSRRPFDWLSRKPSPRFIVSRDIRTIEGLFDQPGFDWTLRGQMAFLLEVDDFVNPAPVASPDALAACLEFDPPRRAPTGCIAILRPGTDGDFAEFNTANSQVAKAFERHFAA